MERITSKDNPIIKSYAKLQQKKYRERNKLFIVEGQHLVDEATNINIVKQVLTSDSSKKGLLVSDEIIKHLTSTKTPQDIIAICKIIDKDFSGQKIIMIENVQDPGNLGTLIRTARAFNYDGIIYSGVDLYNDKVIRSSQGAIFSIPIKKVKNIIEHMGEYNVYASILNKDAKSYKDLNPQKPFAILLGNESSGISKEAISKSKDSIYIPIDFESLNVAQAGAIIMAEYNDK